MQPSPLLRLRSLLLVFALGFTVPIRAQEPEDAYLAGYAAAILEHEFQIPKAVVVAQGGVLTIGVSDMGNADVERVRTVLGQIRGVRAVQIERDPAAVARLTATRQPTEAPVTTVPGQAGVQAESSTEGGWFFRDGPMLFEALHADPRWPHFSATYQYYVGNEEWEHAGVATFGESFSFYRNVGPGLRWEFGVQAGVTSIFDLGAPSLDLINADYLVGPFVTLRTGGVSLLTRAFHISSHLGDEYLLRTQAQRLNVSYEAVEALLSVDIGDPLRLYGGGGVIFDSDLDPGFVQVGAELFGSELGSTAIRPLLVADLQAREESDWHGDLSVRAGIEFTTDTARSRRVQLLLEYYNGSSPHGQFFVEDVEFYGLGLHLHF